MLPAPKKEQALEQRVVERVQQGARDAAQRDELVARGFAQRGDAESDEDDADVLDRGVGQQAFHVVLHGCEDHAHRPVTTPAASRITPAVCRRGCSPSAAVTRRMP